MEKGEIAQNGQFHLFPQCFLCNLYLTVPLIAKFQLSPAASLNLGQSQNGVLGNGLANTTLKCPQRRNQFHLRMSSYNVHVHSVSFY